MFKVLAVILSLNLLVASQELGGDGLGGLLALNMLSGGRNPLGSLFGMGRPQMAYPPQLARRTGQAGATGSNANSAVAAAMAAAAARRQSPLGGGLANIFLLDTIGWL
ncbi:hypothetical protein ACF0H5_018827 [Mactra antiquata]